jgi:hypothetical protein
MYTSLRQIEQDIYDVCGLIDLLAADVERCPQLKRPSRWYLDRVAELARLRAKHATLVGSRDYWLATRGA